MIYYYLRSGLLEELREFQSILGKECADLMDCEIYKNYCDHKDYSKSLKYYCRASCGFCKGNYLILIY